MSTPRHTNEIHLPQPDPDNWVLLDKTGGIRVNALWEHPDTGASITLLDIPAGAGIPVRHTHASNQFMYCLSGTYEYLQPDPGLTLEPGHFYMNPKGNPHGPTRAVTDCLILEIYDGAHYAELPPYHSAQTVGRIDPDAFSPNPATDPGTADAAEHPDASQPSPAPRG